MPTLKNRFGARCPRSGAKGSVPRRVNGVENEPGKDPYTRGKSLGRTHHEKLLNQPTGIQFFPVLHTGIWYTRENKFHTRESLSSLYSRVHHGNMSIEWYTREYEFCMREYDFKCIHGNMNSREYWIKVNLVLVSHTRLERTPSDGPHFVSFRVQNLSKYATHTICNTDFPWQNEESR